MTRVGPWMLVSGIVLLGAGIASSGLDSWKHKYRERRDDREQTIALDMREVESVEDPDRVLGGVVIAHQPAQIRIQRYGSPEGRENGMPVTLATDGKRLRLGAASAVQGQLTLEIPPGVRSLTLGGINIQAKVNAGDLRIESSHLTWTGDAGALDLRVRDTSANDRRVGAPPGVVFNSGSVDALRISVERGHINLGNLANVGTIEIHAGPGVGLSVRQISDLQRIKLLPFDGEPALSPDAPGTTRNCGIRPGYAD